MTIQLTLSINDSERQQLSVNLRRLLDERQVTENEIAQFLEIPVMTVRRIVSGETADPRISTLKLIADYFNVSLDSLIGDHYQKSTRVMKKNLPAFVPVLDWKTLTQMASIKELDLTAWKAWQPVIMNDATALSDEAFAIESRPSMQPRFPLGTLFIVDPKETPADGDIALIKMRSNDNLSLRELIIDSPRWQLQPIITGSELLFFDPQQHQIVGIVVLTMLHARKEK